MTGTPVSALTIAGSDSGGGAGIQADLATFAAYGVHGATALTAVTVQDTTGVHAVHPLPADLVVAQSAAVLADLPVAAVKTGMLAVAQTVRAVAALAARGRLPRLVIDPVLVSTSGHPLMSDEATEALRADLLGHAMLLTPNVEEAGVLLRASPAQTLAEQCEQAAALRALGPQAVVVTGGVDGPDRVDVLATSAGVVALRAPTIDTTNDHGTGCTFAAAATAALALGATVDAAVASARDHVRGALLAAAGWSLGRGRGPVSHLARPAQDPQPHSPSQE